MHLSQWSLLIDIVQKFKFRFSKKAEKVWQNLPVLLWNYRNVRAKLEDFVIFLETRNFMSQFCLLYKRNLIHCIKLHILCIASHLYVLAYKWPIFFYWAMDLFQTQRWKKDTTILEKFLNPPKVFFPFFSLSSPSIA